MKELRVNKSVFQIDHEGWLSIRDGHVEAGLPPDEVEALRKFLVAGREDVGIEGAGLGLKPGPFLDDARKLAAEVESWPEYKRDIYVSAQGSGFKDGAGSATPPRALRAEIRDRLIAFLEESGCECDKTTGHVCESCSLLISLLAKPGEAASAEPEQSPPSPSSIQGQGATRSPASERHPQSTNQESK